MRVSPSSPQPHEEPLPPDRDFARQPTLRKYLLLAIHNLCRLLLLLLLAIPNLVLFLLEIGLICCQKLAIIESPSLVASSWLEKKVGQVIHPFELGKSPQSGDVVGQRHQLRLEGRVQLYLLFRGQGQQVAMVDSQSQEIILTKMLKKTFKRW